MTSTMSLFACAAADVTLERVEELVDQAPPESLTLEFKERYILVVRVDPARAPRPLLMGGAAPVRLEGRNATADRARLWQLFSEAPTPLQASSRWLNAPDLPSDANGAPTADFVIRTG